MAYLGQQKTIGFFWGEICHVSLSHLWGLKQFPCGIHHRIQTSHLHASHCYYCKVDFVSFHEVIRYNISLLSRFQFNATNLLNIMSTLVVIGVILGRFKCIAINFLDLCHFVDHGIMCLEVGKWNHYFL